MLKVGLCGEGGRGVPDIEGLQVFEIRASGLNLPSNKVCKEWKQSAPEELCFMIRIPEGVFCPSGSHEPSSFLASPKDVSKSWKKVVELADEMDVDTLSFALPPWVTPTEHNRKKLLWFLNDMAGGAFRIVWEPAGLWTEEDVYPVAKDSNIIVGMNEIPEWGDIGEDDWLFLRYRGLGRSQLSGDTLYDLAEFCAGPWLGVCLLDVPRPNKDFEALMKALENCSF